MADKVRNQEILVKCGADCSIKAFLNSELNHWQNVYNCYVYGHIWSCDFVSLDGYRES